jgi:ABC-type Fe3+/spermidine/putrescine transport system ATPase subunit
MRFEIRRLHETFGITTLYVTHDQAEAMVISDRIAVLQHGRVVQVGSAEEIFHQPRTRFVAEFIGRTNLIEAVVVAPDAVVCGSVRLRVAPVGLEPGARVVVSIRPHAIELIGDGGGGGAPNMLDGVVKRASFLGDSLDYEIALAGSDLVIRATTPATRRLRPGQRVILHVDPEACVPLPDAPAS